MVQFAGAFDYKHDVENRLTATISRAHQLFEEWHCTPAS